MNTTFGRRLRAAFDRYGHLCVGIDPHPHLLQAWNLDDSPDGLHYFAMTVCDRLEGTVGILKPQSAFFERHGSSGVAVLEQVIKRCQASQTLCIMDVKRGDIGSTMAGYGWAYLDERSPLRSDAMTVSPYLGTGSLQPAVDCAVDNDRGVFVLCLTSNPQGPEVQHSLCADGRSVALAVAEYARSININYVHTGDDDATQMGPCGLVVGATVGKAVSELGITFDNLHAPLLVPGIGAQGGTAADIVRLFGKASANVIASVSRSVLSGGPNGLVDAATRENDALLAIVN
ncbi:MAG: orotidine-5'-phosphate decarboxylase [Actinomycetaceae bacterium]|nr:orotidine-5'-phosphate decarboxylase [Actinomycetaceae bacterium]